jgi:phenylacetic acid degradation operon negative regulatory protein
MPSEGGAMQARSALFDLYGDHLRHRGGVAPVAALVRLLAPLEIASAAVRTAISRMVRQGWLEPAATGSGPGYALTRRATRRLDEAAIRIYRSRPAAPWDGRWSVASLNHSPQRTTRERLARALEYLGYRQLESDLWVAPRSSPELDAVVAAEGLRCVEFRGALVGDDAALAERLYAPAELAVEYRNWLATAEALVATAGGEPTDEVAFATRSELLHEWRKFLFRDPGLPRELLPDGWPGEVAAAYFDAQAARLLPGANRFVDCCLEGRDA